MIPGLLTVIICFLSIIQEHRIKVTTWHHNMHIYISEWSYIGQMKFWMAKSAFFGRWGSPQKFHFCLLVPYNCAVNLAQINGIFFFDMITHDTYLNLGYYLYSDLFLYIYQKLTKSSRKGDLLCDLDCETVKLWNIIVNVLRTGAKLILLVARSSVTGSDFSS